MSDENLLTRREFTVESALAMLAGVTITISGCGDDDNATPAPTPTPPPAADKTGTVSTRRRSYPYWRRDHGGSIDGWKCNYLDPYGRHHTHSHGGAQSDRAHDDQRRDAVVEDVVHRQLALAHRDVQLTRDSGFGIRDSGFGIRDSGFEFGDSGRRRAGPDVRTRHIRHSATACRRFCGSRCSRKLDQAVYSA